MDTRPPGVDPSVLHETRDADTRSLLIFAGVLVGTIVFLLFLMAGVFHYFGQTQSLGPPASPFTEARPLPPGPRLQVEPRLELGQLHTRDEEKLNSYGWVDRNAGVVRIPIERAMDLVVEKGLPTRAEGGAQK